MEKFIHYTKIFAVFYLAGAFLTWVGYQLGELNEMEKELKRQRKRMKELNIIDENGNFIQNRKETK